MQIWNEDGQGSLFAHDGCAGKMCPARSAQGPPRGRTSASSSRRSSELRTIPFMSLDLTPGHGNLLGESYWELISPSPGGSSTLNTGPAPLSEEDVFSLSQILQDAPPRKYYLSRTACLGILRRATERRKELPPQLKTALMAQAGLIPLAAPASEPIAFAANQRDEVCNLHNAAGALSPQPGMKQQAFIAQDCLNPWDTQQARVFTPGGKAPTLASVDGGGGRNPAGLLFVAETAGSLTPWDNQQRRISTPLGVAPTINSGEQKPGGLVFTAGFCAGAAPTAGGIGYQVECAPTLKASESGTNMVPSVLCLNDQGGVIACSEDVAGTLRAQEHGYQPLVIGMRYEETPSVIELFENLGIDARYTGPYNISPTLTNRNGTGGNNLPILLDTHDRFLSRQRVDAFMESTVASTESARQHKDATDLVLQETKSKSPLLIRRLTPLECERLQGFPDSWTELQGASDSARYRALGNSVAIPCVEYIMRGITYAFERINDNAK